MNFPVYISYGGELRVYETPAAFIYGYDDEAVQHPHTVWGSWTQEDWVHHCPGFVFLTVQDDLPTDVHSNVRKLNPQDWDIVGDIIKVKYEVTAKTEEQIAQENAQLIAQVGFAVQMYMDTQVKSRNYDTILSACTYATSTIPKYQAEGQACVEWRDAVWVKCFQLLDEVKTGVRAKMTPAEVVAELPELIWPTV